MKVYWQWDVMINVVKTIVDNKRHLIGLVLEGKSKEFGEMGNEKVQKHLTLAQLAQKKFKNKQLVIRPNGTVVEARNFSLHDLPMCSYAQSKFVDIDNRITLSHRYLQDENVVGFGVVFGDGTKLNFRYADVLRLSFWFKPTNFVVRRTQTDKLYIAGKGGVLKLDELPTTDIGTKEKKNKHVKSSATSQSQIKENSNIDGVVDIFEVYKEVADMQGLILKLPNEKYTKTTKESATISEEFQPLGIGEYAFPNLSFNETKLNANTNFRKPGMVTVNINGQGMQLPSYVNKKKNVFFNGENYIKNLGVAVPQDKKAEFINRFGKSMGITPLKDDKLIKTINSLTGRTDFEFYKLSTDNLELITTANIPKSILSSDELYKLVNQIFMYKCITKYTSPSTGLLKQIAKSYKTDLNEQIGNKPVGIFGGFSKEYLEAVQESGINVYTGGFVKTHKPTTEESKEDAVDQKREKEANEVSIEYCIKGKEVAKWTFSRISKALEKGKDGNDYKILPPKLIEIYNKLQSLNNDYDKVTFAYKAYNAYNEKLDALLQTMWKHKCAMYLATDKSHIQQHDRTEWEEDTTRRTKATIYNNNKHSGLMLAALNITV